MSMCVLFDNAILPVDKQTSKQHTAHYNEVVYWQAPSQVEVNM